MSKRARVLAGSRDLRKVREGVWFGKARTSSKGSGLLKLTMAGGQGAPGAPWEVG